MVRITAWVTTLVALAAGALVGCGGGGGDATTAGDRDSARYEGAIASDDVAHGQQVVADLCMSCHANGAPALENLGWEPARMRHQIREGSGRMPALTVDRISDEDMEAALAYLVTIGAVVGDGVSAPTSGGTDETMGDQLPAEGDDAEDVNEDDEVEDVD